MAATPPEGALIGESAFEVLPESGGARSTPWSRFSDAGGRAGRRRTTAAYGDAQEQAGDPEVLRRVERDVMLQIVDAQWKDHLYSLDHLKEGISLRSYAQKDPLVEYKRESFALFQGMKDRIDTEMIRYLWRLRPVVQGQGDEIQRPTQRPRAPLTLNDPGATASAFAGGGSAARAPQPARTGGDDAKVKTIRRDTP